MYAGSLAALAGVGAVLARRRWGLGLLLGGPGLAVVGLLLPAHERRITSPVTSLDRFMPAWQFREVHAIDVNETCERAFAALEQLRASDIPLFHTLTWIRRLGRSGPESILNPSDSIPLLAVATRHGFTELAREVPRELVIGTVLIAPTSAGRVTEPDAFAALRDPGYAKAALNFRFRPADSNCSVSTETRVFATDPHSRRVFARYWRVIYPGSALIRRMWLRAARAEAEREST